MTLLIADDSSHKIDLMLFMLRKAGWEENILIAHTSEEAFDLIDANDIAFGLIDYYIPTQNGPAIIARLKKKNPTAHVALVSSSDAQKNFDEAKAAGAETCICTTYPSDEVERVFMKLLMNWKQ
jgi:DNA-binding NarL/FixJ family response regulator